MKELVSVWVTLFSVWLRSRCSHSEGPDWFLFFFLESGWIHCYWWMECVGSSGQADWLGSSVPHLSCFGIYNPSCAANNLHCNRPWNCIYTLQSTICWFCTCNTSRRSLRCFRRDTVDHLGISPQWCYRWLSALAFKWFDLAAEPNPPHWHDISHGTMQFGVGCCLPAPLLNDRWFSRFWLIGNLIWDFSLYRFGSVKFGHSGKSRPD